MAPVGLKVSVSAVLAPVPLPLHPLAEVVAAGARVSVVEGGHQELLLLVVVSASCASGIRGLRIKKELLELFILTNFLKYFGPSISTNYEGIRVGIRLKRDLVKETRIFEELFICMYLI